jgi:hypothetical protein
MFRITKKRLLTGLSVVAVIGAAGAVSMATSASSACQGGAFQSS